MRSSVMLRLMLFCHTLTNACLESRQIQFVNAAKDMLLQGEAQPESLARTGPTMFSNKKSLADSEGVALGFT